MVTRTMVEDGSLPCKTAGPSEREGTTAVSTVYEAAVEQAMAGDAGPYPASIAQFGATITLTPKVALETAAGRGALPNSPASAAPPILANLPIARLRQGSAGDARRPPSPSVGCP